MSPFDISYRRFCVGSFHAASVPVYTVNTAAQSPCYAMSTVTIEMADFCSKRNTQQVLGAPHILTFSITELNVRVVWLYVRGEFTPNHMRKKSVSL